MPLATAVAQRGQRLVLESVRKGHWCVVACAQSLLEKVTRPRKKSAWTGEESAGRAGRGSGMAVSRVRAPLIVATGWCGGRGGCV